VGIIDAALRGFLSAEFIESGFSKNCFYSARRVDVCALIGRREFRT
jgi:hypothetical protein